MPPLLILTCAIWWKHAFGFQEEICNSFMRLMESNSFLYNLLLCALTTHKSVVGIAMVTRHKISSENYCKSKHLCRLPASTLVCAYVRRWNSHLSSLHRLVFTPLFSIRHKRNKEMNKKQRIQDFFQEKSKLRRKSLILKSFPTSNLVWVSCVYRKILISPKLQASAKEIIDRRANLAWPVILHVNPS